MTTINLAPSVIEVKVSAANAINKLGNAIAHAIAELGYAEVELNDGLWGVYMPAEDEHIWVPGTVSEAMLSVQTLWEAYLSKGWMANITVDGNLRIDYPEITTIIELDPEEDEDGFS